MPMCLAYPACKEVVYPDKKGNPIGGLTCASFCKDKALPPGYAWWEAAIPVNGELVKPPNTLAFVDTDTGDTVELSRGDVRFIIAAARRKGWL